MFLLIFFILSLLAMDEQRPLIDLDINPQISYRVADLSQALSIACIKGKNVVLRKAYHLWMERIQMDADFLSSTSQARLKTHMKKIILSIQGSAGDKAFANNEQYKKDQLYAIKKLREAVVADHCDCPLWINEFKQKKRWNTNSESIKQTRLARLKDRETKNVTNEYYAAKNLEEDSTINLCAII